MYGDSIPSRLVPLNPHLASSVFLYQALAVCLSPQRGSTGVEAGIPLHRVQPHCRLPRAGVEALGVFFATRYL